MVKFQTKISRSKSLELLFTAISLVLLFVLFISCSKDENIPEVVTNSLALKIDNQDLKITNQSISSNENCNGVFASCRYETKDDVGFRIEFRLNKNGALRNITLFDYRNKNSQFESADFNPKGLMEISNFSYDEKINFLYFDFKGELLEQSDDYALDIDKKRKHIEGSITIEEVKNTACTSFISDLNFKATDLNFFSNLARENFDSSLKINPYQYWFYSDNGYKTTIKSNKDLWNLDKRTYTFDQNNDENRIDFEQYIANFRSTQLLAYQPKDWKKFQTSGHYTIIEHIIINGVKITKGVMGLQVYDNGVLLHTITDGKFEVASF